MCQRGTQQGKSECRQQTGAEEDGTWRMVRWSPGRLDRAQGSLRLEIWAGSCVYCLALLITFEYAFAFAFASAPAGCRDFHVSGPDADIIYWHWRVTAHCSCRLQVPAPLSLGTGNLNLNRGYTAHCDTDCGI